MRTRPSVKISHLSTPFHPDRPLGSGPPPTADWDDKFTERYQALESIGQFFPQISDKKKCDKGTPEVQTELSVSLWPGKKKWEESSFLLINNYNSPPFPSNSSQKIIFPPLVMNQVIHEYTGDSV